MKKQYGFKLVPKIKGNMIGLFVYVPSTEQSRQVALVETPNDYQLNDDMELAEEICKAYRKRMNKSINT